MKKLALAIAVTLLALSPVFSSRAQVKTVTLDDLTQNISSRNLTVLEEAQRTYQAKVAIEQARLALLPRLNIWQIAKLFNVLVDPFILLDAVNDIAPFLVPANWFRIEETEILYRAQQEGYQGLWANELLSGRSLYYRVLMDGHLRDIVGSQAKELRKLYDIAHSRYLTGLERLETVQNLEIQALKLEQDLAELNQLMSQELSILSMSMGLPAEEGITLEEIALKDPNLQIPIAYDAYVDGVLSVAPEIKQYEEFLRVIPKIKKEIYFNFLGVSEVSRGVAGGIFDAISIPNGLGFENGAAMKIVRSQKEILTLQKQGVTETIKRQLQNVVGTFNQVVTYYSNAQRQEELAASNVELMQNRMMMGEKIDLNDLAVALEQKSILTSARFELTYRFALQQDRLSRLMLSEDFAKHP